MHYYYYYCIMVCHSFLYLSILCCPDVLALAAAITELTSHTRRSRTTTWCALQMSSRDVPQECVKSAEQAVHSYLVPALSIGTMLHRQDVGDGQCQDGGHTGEAKPDKDEEHDNKEVKDTKEEDAGKEEDDNNNSK